MKYYKVFIIFGICIMIMGFFSMFELFGGATLKTMYQFNVVGFAVAWFGQYLKEKNSK